MQMTIYYSKDDEWIIKELQIRAYAERRSVSQVVLSALEEYFSRRGEVKPRGEIPKREHEARGRPRSE